MSTPARPELEFKTFDEMLSDVGHLKGGTYEKFGQWDLGMMLDHLAKSIGTPFVVGKRNYPWPVGPVARIVIGRFARMKKYPRFQFSAPKAIKPSVGIDDNLAFEELKTSVEKLSAVPGPWINVPPIGRVKLEDFVRVQLLHAAHHLSYLKPVA